MQIREEHLPLVQQRAVRDHQDRAELQVLARRTREFFDVVAQGRLPAGEEDRIGFPSDNPQQLDRSLRGKLLAEDIRLLLRAVSTVQVAAMRGIEDRGVGRHDVRRQDFAPVEVLEVVFEVLEDKRVVAHQSAQQDHP